MGKLILNDDKDDPSYNDSTNVQLLTKDFFRLATSCAIEKFPFIKKWKNQQETDEINFLLKSSNDEAAFLRPSIFEHMPPTIKFYGETTKIKKPSLQSRKALLWAHNSLLPIPMRHIIRQNHFVIKPMEDEKNWVGYWGKHWKNDEYKLMNINQKVNHYPGSFHIGRKDKIWEHLQEFRQLYGNEFNIMPETFLMPDDLNKLSEYLQVKDNAVILKPPSSARGTGISIISNENEIPELDLTQKKCKFWIAQKYLNKPYLIDGKKFDLRIYAYAPRLDPLIIYIYEEGLVRFASLPYKSEELSNQYIHLTNYSINKHAVKEGISINDVDKWSLEDFWKYLDKNNYNSKKLKAEIYDIIIKTIISCETHIRDYMNNSNIEMTLCHELFGFDILLDSNLKPWLLEANLTPSLQAHTDVDKKVKWPLIKDVLTMCRYIFPISNTKLDNSLGHATKHCNGNITLKCIEKMTEVINEYKNNKKILSNIINEDNLTGTDIRCICNFEDEYDCKGKFELVYPNPNINLQNKYFNFIKNPTYFDILMHVWCSKRCISKHNHEELLNLLHKMCYLGNHIVTNDLRI